MKDVQLNNIFIINTLRYIYGNKKIKILEYLIKKSDEKHFILTTYQEIMDAVGVSKPTVVELFKVLKKNHLLYKEKNGLYRLNDKIFQKEFI